MFKMTDLGLKNGKDKTYKCILIENKSIERQIKKLWNFPQLKIYVFVHPMLTL